MASPRTDAEGGHRTPHPFRLAAAFTVSVVVGNVGNAVLSLIGRQVFSVPNNFTALLPERYVPVTAVAVMVMTGVWLVLARRASCPELRFYQAVRAAVVCAVLASLALLRCWQEVLGVVTLMLMTVVGAVVVYLALTRIASARRVRH
ncbi:MAG: hypothetical protein JOZ47_17830 [Kutzneria sp.]|nr:hypothetical protein [Kutzneria sp.]MBV9846906.1 hypothetical protein [Kutzneria sp.]